MKQSKGLHKVLSLILVVCFLLQPINNINVKAASDVTLNLADGIITVTNRDYIQKTSANVVVASGTVDADSMLILTGIQSSGWAVTVNGSNVPTIRYKNVNTNGNIIGTVTGTLNIEIEGICTFNGGITYYSSTGFPSLNNLIFTGIEGNEIYGSDCRIIAGSSSDLTINNLNFYTTNGYSLTGYNNFYMDNVYSYTSSSFSINNQATVTTKGAYISNCYFKFASIYCYQVASLDNVVVDSGSAVVLSSAKKATTSVNNCDITTNMFAAIGTTNHIIDSKIVALDASMPLSSTVVSPYWFTYSTYLKGSTLILPFTNTSSAYDVLLLYTSTIVFDDSSAVFEGPKTDYRRFNTSTSTSTTVDPVNSDNKTLYLNKVFVPGASSSRVNLSIDGRDSVNLWTDKAGYLYLYLTIGEHEVNIYDFNENDYKLTFEGMTTRELDDTSNIIGSVNPVIPPTTVTLSPYANTEIKYSFDRSTWIEATTDSNCQFSVVFPSGIEKIYLKVDGIMYTGLVNDGVLGSIEVAKPTIIAQSGSESKFITGSEAVLYVNAKSVLENSDLTYQWSKDGEELSSAAESVLVIPNVQKTDSGVYTCEVNEIGTESTISNPIVLTVTDGIVDDDLCILAQSDDKSLIVGYATDLFVIGNLDGTIYQWYQDGEVLDGETGSTIHISPIVTGSAIYTCTLIKDGDTVESNPITVTVEDNPLADDLADLTQVANDLTTQLNTRTKELEIATNDKNLLQETVTDLESQIFTLQRNITDLNIQVTDLQQQLLDEQVNNDTLNQTIIELQNQINYLNGQIDSLQDDLDTANQDKVNLELTIMDLNNDINNLNSQITLLEKRLNESEEENTELKNQVIQLQNSITGLQTHVTNLQNEINELTLINNNLLTQVESLTEQKESLLNDMERLEDLLEDANETIGNLTEQVNNLTNQVNTLTSQLNTSNQEKAALQENITGLEAQITNLNNQILDLDNEITNLKSELQQEGADKESLNQMILTLNNQMLTLNDTVSNLQGQLEAVTLERNTLQTTVNMLNNQVLDMINQITALESRLLDSEEENTELRNQVIELQNTISELQTDGETLQNELEDLLNNNKNLQEQLNIANGTIDTLSVLINLIKAELGVIGEDEIIPAIQQLKAQLAQELTHNGLLQEQITNLNLELTHAKDSNTTLLSKLEELYLLVGEEDIDGIKVKIIELQTTLVKSETRIVELEQERNQLLKDLDDAKEQNHFLQEKIDELLALSDLDVEELKKQILTLTGQINEMIVLNNELKESVNNLNNQVTEMSAEKAVLESEIIRLQTLLESANSTIEELREQLGDLAADKSILEQENATLKAEIEKLKKQLQSGNSSTGNGNTVVDNSKEIKDLQDSLDQAFLELETVKKELEQAKKELEETTSNDETDNKDNMVIKIPENSVVILPAKKTVETVIKEVTDKPISEEKIIAEEGWEIAPTLESIWAKEINLLEAVGQTNKEEVVEYSFYAREETNPEEVYNYAVDVNQPVAIPNLTIDKIIYLGSTFKLNVANIADKETVTYKSTDSSIATVTKTGTITPIKSGKTQITGIATKDGIPYQFTVNVTVKDGDNRTLNLKEQEIQTSTNEPVLMVYKLINKDKTTKVNLEGYAKNAIVTYISSDASIATVNQDGIIKGIKKGNTTITAILTQNNTIYTYIIKVRVDDGTVDNTMWEYLTAS